MSPSLSLLIGAVGDLRDAVDALRLPLDVPGVEAARRTQVEVGQVLDDYLLPRLAAPDGPLVVVVGGATGVGKSTLVNSLVGSVVSSAGAVRPTTRAPVMVCHPRDFYTVAEGDGRLLPGLTGAGSVLTGSVIVPVTSVEVPAGVVLVDAPDINSVAEDNRALGERLMAAADVLVLVTSAERYADAVPWRQLKRAVERQTPLLVVLDRVEPGTTDEVQGACAALLAANGLADAPLFVVQETSLIDGLLPHASVFPLLTWLRDTGADPLGRLRLSGRAVAGRLSALAPKIEQLAVASEGQREAVVLFEQAVERVYTAERVRFRGGLDDGELFGGELLIRWQELIGTDRIHALLQAPDHAGKLWSRARDADAPPLRAALVAAVAQAYQATLDRSARKTAEQWRLIPGGPALLPVGKTIDPVAAAVGWLDRLPGAVRDQTRSKRSGKILAGPGARGAGLLLAVAAVSGKDDSGDPTTVAAYGLIRTLFGVDDADRLLATARTGLRDTCAALLERSADVHRAQLADYGIRPHLAEALRSAQQEVQKQR